MVPLLLLLGRQLANRLKYKRMHCLLCKLMIPAGLLVCIYFSSILVAKVLGPRRLQLAPLVPGRALIDHIP